MKTHVYILHFEQTICSISFFWLITCHIASLILNIY